MPHHFAATEEDAARMGDESFGRVNPPLRSEADRQSLVAALFDGTIDAVATDHAPHSHADKAKGAPGFSALESAFAVSFSLFAQGATFSGGDLPAIGNAAPQASENLRLLSRLMSANPARILRLADGQGGRGRIAEDLRADFAIVDPHAQWKIDPAQFKSRGKCSPFAGREFRGRVAMTVKAGRIVYG
jgi:dihydroorotase